MKKFILIGVAVVAVGGVAYFMLRKNGKVVLEDTQATDSQSPTVNSLIAQEVSNLSKPLPSRIPTYSEEENKLRTSEVYTSPVSTPVKTVSKPILYRPDRIT